MSNQIKLNFYRNINVEVFSFCSFLFKAQAEKGIALHIDASSVVWTLIDKGKLANQIARSTAIVLKKEMIGYYQGG